MFSFVQNCFYSLLSRYFIAPIRNHVFDLAYYLDPLADKQKNEKRNSHNKKDFTFLFPALAVLATWVYGNVYFVYLSSENMPTSLSSIWENPLLMYHQIFPQASWSQVDFGYTIFAATAFAIFFTLFARSSKCNCLQYSKIKTEQGGALLKTGANKKRKNF